MIARLLCLVLLIVSTIPSWGVVATQQYESYQYDGSYIAESTQNYNYGIVQKLLSERTQKTLESLSKKPLDRSFFVLLGDFIVTKKTGNLGDYAHNFQRSAGAAQRVPQVLQSGGNKLALLHK